MKSIRTRILLWIVILAAVPAISIGIVASVLAYNNGVTTAEEEIETLSQNGAARLTNRLDSYLNIAEVMGSTQNMAFANMDVSRQQEVLNGIAERQGLAYANVVDANGIGRFDSLDYSERPFFQHAIEGTSYVSDPIVSKGSGLFTIQFAAPIWQDGIVGTENGGTVIGVVYFEATEGMLDTAIKEVNIGGNSRAYVLNGDGQIVIYPLQDDDTNAYSSTVYQYYDGTLSFDRIKSGNTKLAEIYQKTMNQEEGESSYTSSNGEGEMLIAYRSLTTNANNWSLCVEAPTSDFMGSVYTTMTITIILVVVFIAAAVFVAIIIANSISKPITSCANRIKALADGDISSPAAIVNRADETGTLSRSTSDVVGKLDRIIGDIDRLLGSMADGNFNSDINMNADAYVGDFASLLSAIGKINKDLSDTLGKIDVAAEQVSSGSDQVSAGAQDLSQGATEQASSIEELAATITEISGKTEENLQDCNQAKANVDETTNLMAEASRQMHSLTEAMGRISDASSKIEKIIKAIEDIAFQTNILALNAAVEAAKAGEAGKGFAVVAEEVRNLAAKSQEAVKSTSALIGESVEAVQDGTRITDETSATLEKVVASAEAVSNIVTKVAESSETQTVSIQQVTVGIDQISSVVQTNSATAEESAAASEELNSQAQMLKSLVGQFELNSSSKQG